MTKCKECKAKIIVIPNGIDDIWIHSILEEGKTCDFSDEGIRISVIDPIIQSAFKKMNKQPTTLWGKVSLFLYDICHKSPK